MEATEEETPGKKNSDDEESNNDESSEVEFLDLQDKFSESEGANKRKGRRSSGVWQFYEVLDEKERLAACTLCQERHSYRSTSGNLRRHLRRKHNIEFVDGKAEGQSDKEECSSKRANTSAAWRFFSVLDAPRRLAACALCGAACSYRSTVSNLLKHVRRKHPQLAAAGGDNGHDHDDEDSGASPAPRMRSPLWRYFAADPRSRRAACLLCRRRLSYSSLSNLKRHLQKKHPQLDLDDDSKRVLFSSDGQLFELEDKQQQDSQPTIDIDSVFIDDYEGDLAEKPETKTDNLDLRETKRKKDDPRATKRKKRIPESSDSDTSSEKITFQKRRRKSDTLDQFGRYLISKMKELPKELSNQLQMEFVKQVITAQLTYECQQKVPVTVPVSDVPVPNNGYSITISNQLPGDHQYVVEEQVVDTL